MVGWGALLAVVALGAEAFPVEVRTVPPGATARAEGLECVTPCSLTLEVGSHQVVVQLAGHADQEAKVEVFGPVAHEVRFGAATNPGEAGPPAASLEPLGFTDWDAMRAPQDEALEAKARLKREEAIGRLRELLAKKGESSARAEMLLRLSDLLYQQAVAASPQDPASTWAREAADGYRSILAQYPLYPRCDQATYFLGMASYRLEESDAAKGHFKDLVKRFPDSQFVPQSYLMLGELYAPDDGYASLKGFLKAASFADYQDRKYAIYRLAWAYRAVGEPGKAVSEMKRVVESDMLKSQEPLREAALRALVVLFREAGLAEEGEAYLRARGRSDLL